MIYKSLLPKEPYVLVSLDSIPNVSTNGFFVCTIAFPIFPACKMSAVMKNDCESRQLPALEQLYENVGAGK